MIVYLYGLPGVGKNFIGEIFKNEFNFHFQDADEYLTVSMKNKLRKGEHFTIKEVEEYHKIIAYNIFELRFKHSNLVITQASLFKKHRNIIKKLNPEINFIHINSDLETINKRIKKRKGYVTKEYSDHLLKFLEVDENDMVIENYYNTTVDTLINKINNIL